MAAMARLRDDVAAAKLDALIVVGDDQEELFHHDNMPGILVYYGETIRNVPLAPVKEPNWGWRASARWHEEKEPRDYPVDSGLARHLIDQLIEREFDLAASAATPDGEGEGHAVGFVHRRILQDVEQPMVPIVPVCINTYYPPNQPTPRRCYKLGLHLRKAILGFPDDLKVAIVGTGGLSHQLIGERAGFNNEAWDLEFLDLITRDPERLAAMSLDDFMRLGGNEGAEVIMWLIMRGALGPTVRKLHQSYYLPMTTAMAVALFE